MHVVFSDKNEIPRDGIFLAGPTKRNAHYSTSWRNRAVQLLELRGFDGVIYVPEYESSKPFDESLEGVHRQTDWEWRALDKAAVIMFWIPRELPEMPAFTTNVEFGRYTALVPNKVVLGYPVNAQKMRYLAYLYTKVCDREPSHTLESTITEALNLYSQNSLINSVSSTFIQSLMTDYTYTDEDFLEFKQTDECKLCGTQRCMADLDTLHEVGPCIAFKQFLEQKQQNNINRSIF